MPNELLGEFELEIGGRLRPFRFSMVEAYKIDRAHLKTGERSVLQLNEQSINVPLLMDVMHVGLQAHEPHLRVETVGAWLTQDADKLPEYFAFLGKVVSNLFGRAKKKELEQHAPLDAPAADAVTSTGSSEKLDAVA